MVKRLEMARFLVYYIHYKKYKGVNKILKKIAVVNDLSGFGKCSLSVALPIISALGIEACPLPTAVLSNQTGYPQFFCKDLTDTLPQYIKNWQRLNASFEGILTGYITSEKQADIICDFIDKFRTPDTLVFVDPIMADDGVIYHTYNSALCEKVKSLVKRANIIAPNLTELCILSGNDYHEIHKNPDLEKIGEIAKFLLTDSLEYVIVTGIKTHNEIYNLIVEKNGTSVVKSRLLGGSFSGTGDIFSSITCGAILRGKSVLDAVSLAAKFIEKSIKNTNSENNYEPDGVNFQAQLEMLING